MKAERAKELIDQFAGKRILVVGDVVLDMYVHGQVERLNPEAPVPIVRAGKEEERTGGAGNVAKNAAALGATTKLISVVGNDGTAKRIEQAAFAEGYQPYLIQDATRPTIRKVRYLANGQQLLRVDYEATHDISEAVEAKVISAVEKDGATVDAIIISDYAKGVITKGVAEATLAATKKDMVIAADVKPSRAEFVSGATLISPNRKEAHEFLGLHPLEQPTDTGELAKRLREKMNSTVFITLGDGGIYLLGDDEQGEHVPQKHVVEVHDVSGAGDTIIVLLTLARLAGASDHEAAELANAAGAVVVSKPGTVGVTSEELFNMTTHHREV